ncbi:phenylalanine--tRNA ligase subunit beta [Demequina sp. NBRC 110052]|uniref:phenylalanine--tRNA ligase subunit beta n=1 Tax=Demequina sp. NBRC 110052 TaxID=1570341 RepID=UPI0009FCFC69|nr:phenylalanine--tRNA ligase subunit beta [Demequina sp. NBRC 110052]
MPKIPLKWLEESVDLVPGSSAEDVASALVKVGLEEEGIEGGSVTGPLVIGRVISLVKEAQSNGKTINYCRVDVGEHNDPAGPGHKPDNKDEYPASRGIVCGAHNFVEGDFVVVVLPGAVLPGPFPIGGRKTYGHWSDGMICSAKELGLGEDHAGIIVLKSPSGESDVFAGASVADEDLVPGADAIPLLGLDEKTIEINVTPDRGYSFSVRGVAREYSHSTGQVLRDPAAVPLTGKRGSGFEVDIDDQAPIRGNVGCDRFAARVLRRFDPTAPSPAWMKRRLDQAGMRPISLAVDVTNYVMLELGQPLHAYDLATLHEPIQVRRAKPGEKMTTLDDVERELSVEDLLITDSPNGERGSRAIGLAGVMGGLDTEISETTTDILLEAAHFTPVTIARTARRHKLGSEASRRFERGVDTALPPFAIERALGLMQEFGGGEIEEIYTDVNDVDPVEPILMDPDFPSRIVGVDYAPEAVIESLERVGCKVTVLDGGRLSVVPPTWRPDLEVQVNLVEEVARLEGYDTLPSVLPVAPPGRGYTHSQKVRRSVARTLAEAGLTEVLTYPFMSEQRLDEMLVPEDDIRRQHAVRLANPLSADKPLMRTGMTATLIDAVKTNLGRGAQDVAVYEIGRAYRADHIGQVPTSFSGTAITPDDVERLNEALPGQPRRAAGMMVGNRVPASWNHAAEPFDWTDAIAMVQKIAAVCGVQLDVSSRPFEGLSLMPMHPGRAAMFRLLDGTPVGYAGEIHPKVAENLGLPPRSVGFEVILDPMIEASEGRIAPATPVSQQVLAKEDFAFVVASDVAAGDLVAAVREAGGELVEDAHVFDVYTGEQIGEGKKSLAINVVMRGADRTLSAEEVLAVRESIIAAAGEKFGAVLR